MLAGKTRTTLFALAFLGFIPLAGCLGPESGGDDGLELIVPEDTGFTITATSSLPFLNHSWNGSSMHMRPLADQQAIPVVDAQALWEAGPVGDERNTRLLLDPNGRIVALTWTDGETNGFAYPSIGSLFPDAEQLLWLLPVAWALAHQPTTMDWLGLDFGLEAKESQLRASVMGSRFVYIFRFAEAIAVPVEVVRAVDDGGRDLDARVIWRATIDEHRLGSVPRPTGALPWWEHGAGQPLSSPDGVPVDTSPSAFPFPLREAIDYARDCEETPIIVGVCDGRIKERLRQTPVLNINYARFVSKSGPGHGSPATTYQWEVSLKEDSGSPAFYFAVEATAGPAPGLMKSSFVVDVTKTSKGSFGSFATVPLSRLLEGCRGHIGEPVEVLLEFPLGSFEESPPLVRAQPRFGCLYENGRSLWYDLRLGLPSSIILG